MWYAVLNSYADPDTGWGGFGNTWVVFAFGTKAERDDFVRRDPAAHAIRREDIPRYAFRSLRRPRPFTPERYVWRKWDGSLLSRYLDQRVYVLEVDEPAPGDVPLYGRAA